MGTRSPSHEIVLINPNASARTTAMMTAIAQQALQHNPCLSARVIGITAGRDAEMITTPEALAESEFHVVAAADRYLHTPERGKIDAFIVAAFGDPGVAAVEQRLGVPTIGLAQASVAEALRERRRFGIATTTPALTGSIRARVAELGAASSFTGTRITPGDARALLADPDTMLSLLRAAATECVELDGAEAVIIGGGPLGEAAESLRMMLGIPIIEPIPAACQLACELTSRAPAR